MLEVKKLSKSFGETVACREVSFRVEKGEFFILLGPSGCGKSTILRSVAGLETPENGRIILNGRDITSLSPRERDAAMVFQNYALYPNMSVRGNLEFPLKMRKVPKPERTRAAARIASLLKMDHLLDKKAVKLSGGQQQRVAVGRALVRKPAVFLLDEPLSNLDAKLRHHLRVELAGMHRKLEITTVYVTHDQLEAMTLGDRIAVMKDGRILQVGPPSEVYDRPGDLFTARFIGYPEINVFEAVADNNRIRVPQTGLSLENTRGLPPGRILAATRPEDLRLSGEGEGARARVELTEASGPDTVIHLRVSGIPVRARVSKQERTRLGSEGSELNIDFNPSKVLFFNPEDGRVLP